MTKAQDLLIQYMVKMGFKKYTLLGDKLYVLVRIDRPVQLADIELLQDKWRSR